MKVGDRVTWGACGEKTTVIKMEDCYVTKVTIEYSDKSTAVVDMDELTVLESAPTTPTPPEVILEPGKEYMSESGQRYRCISNMSLEQKEFPIIMEWYRADLRKWRGLYYYTVDGRDKWVSRERIISPWPTHLIVDWSLYSKWTKAVAMDKDGLWYGYTGIPTKLHATWVLQYSMISIPPEYAPKNADGTPWVGNWEDSLVVREED